MKNGAKALSFTFSEKDVLKVIEMANRNTFCYLDDTIDHVKDLDKRANVAVDLILNVTKDRIDLDKGEFNHY